MDPTSSPFSIAPQPRKAGESPGLAAANQRVAELEAEVMRLEVEKRELGARLRVFEEIPEGGLVKNHAKLAADRARLCVAEVKAVKGYLVELAKGLRKMYDTERGDHQAILSQIAALDRGEETRALEEENRELRAEAARAASALGAVRDAAALARTREVLQHVLSGNKEGIEQAVKTLWEQEQKIEEFLGGAARPAAGGLYDIDLDNLEFEKD